METQKVEFKPNWRDEYLKVLSAFANANGGILFIGLDDKGNPVGVESTQKLLENIPNKVRSKLGVIPSVEIENRQDKDIIKIMIKPSSVPISYDGKYFVRSGSTVIELKGKELADFLMGKLGKTWDEFIEEKATFDDIDTGIIDKFKKYAVDRIPSIVVEKDYRTILEKLNLLEGKKIKRATILLFGKNPQKFYN